MTALRTAGYCFYCHGDLRQGQEVDWVKTDRGSRPACPNPPGCVRPTRGSDPPSRPVPVGGGSAPPEAQKSPGGPFPLELVSVSVNRQMEVGRPGDDNYTPLVVHYQQRCRPEDVGGTTQRLSLLADRELREWADRLLGVRR